MSSADFTASNYRGNKRAACDRCRDFKLRCSPRESADGTPDPGKCARCAKAGAVCNFSTSIRGNRSGFKGLPKQGKSFDPNNAPRFNLYHSTAPWGGLGEDGRVYDINNATNHANNLDSLPNLDGSSMRGILDEASGPAGMYTSRTGNDPHAAQFWESSFAKEVASMFGGDEMDYATHQSTMPPADHGMRSTTSDPYPMDAERYANNRNWALNNPLYLDTRETDQGQGTSLGEDSTPTLLSPVELRMIEASRMASDRHRCNSWQPNGDSRSRPSTGGLHGHSQARNGFNPTTPNSASSETIDRSQESPPVPQHSPSTTTTQDIQYQRIQELSALGLRFYAQAKEITSRGDSANPLALDQPNNVAVKVLESSLTFQNLLTSLYPLPSSPSSTEEQNHHHSSSEDEGEDDEGEPPSRSQEKTPQQPRKRSSLRSPHSDNDNNTDNRPFHPPVDMTEVFALLTCYIRTLHLHHLFYSRLSTHLTTLFRHGNLLPPPFPSTVAGTVSLDSFAKFQVWLLVQVSTHILGEIEIALGLPDSYRVSGKDDRAGIFGGTVSVQFIEMTMREEAKSLFGAEKDKIASIRDHLGRLRQLLKGAIDL